jgi:hypothetical protein
MTTATPSYGANVVMTITLAGLANVGSTGIGRQSTAANNAADLADDALVFMKFTSGITTPAGTVFLYAFGGVDGSTFSANAGSTDAALTPTPNSGLKLLDSFATNTAINVTYKVGPYSVAQAFGGTMPPQWGVFVNHSMGTASNATSGNFQVQYIPVKYVSS